jgi:hypothetical protein
LLYSARLSRCFAQGRKGDAVFSWVPSTLYLKKQARPVWSQGNVSGFRLRFNLPEAFTGGPAVALNHYCKNLRIRVKAKGGCLGRRAGKCSKDVTFRVCALLEGASLGKPEFLIYPNWRFSGTHGPFLAQAI